MKIESFIPVIDIIKSNINRTVSTMEDIGGTESTGIKGVNKSYKITTTDGFSWIFKPKGEEYVSRWRYIPPHEQYKREKAAYLVDDQLGWDMMPETKIVTHHEKGLGSLAKWIELGKNIDSNPDEFVSNLDEDDTWKAGLIDAIIGNIDRHSGNFLIEDDKLWLIDHGFSFPSRAAEDDNKSVILSRFTKKIWKKEIPENYLDQLQRLKDKDFLSKMEKILDKEAYDLFLERLRYLLRTGVVYFPKYKIRTKITSIPK